MEMKWGEILRPTNADDISITFDTGKYVSEILVGWNH